ncbi:MAG: aminoacetone oxidase family FAD-binding enzyme, partial [Brevundimonas sp.]
MKTEDYDVLIVGAGAAGMMCAVEAGKRGRRVLVVDHAAAPGEKIRISGGGRCNFTNLAAGPANFLSENPRFATSALRRYTQHDFIALVNRHGIAWHEKTLGQLFCDDSAKQIIAMLTAEMRRAGVVLCLRTGVEAVERAGEAFLCRLSDGRAVRAAALVAATGGKSIPKMGATGWAYDLAAQFGVRVVPTRPALVPLTFEPGLLEQLKPLAGVSVEAVASHGRTRFAEGLLFTHRGLSGPSILQISSFWREGDAITLDLAPGVPVFDRLRAARGDSGRQAVHTALGRLIPARLAESVAAREGVAGNLADQPDRALRRLGDAVNAWTVKPVGSEGYRTAEVTLGGIDTAA